MESVTFIQWCLDHLNYWTIMILMNLVSVWNLMVARTYIQTSIPEDLYEAAVIDGVLDEGVLTLIREFHENRFKSMKKCESCGEFSPPETLFCIFCGSRFPQK